MPDPATAGGTLPALITAVGAAIAGVLGAVALFGRRKPSDEAVAPTPVVDAIERDREIERRLSKLEQRADEHKDHHEDLDMKTNLTYSRLLVEESKEAPRARKRS